MPFSSNDALLIARLLREVAQTEIMPRFRNLADGEVRQKSSPLDLVTDVDEAAENIIRERLALAFPQAVVVGEEATEKDPSLLDRLGDSELAILVDPIDGTKNFAAGLPLFGVMAAVVSRGEVIAGIIYDPLGDDWALAVSGEGAWSERPDGLRRPAQGSGGGSARNDAGMRVLALHGGADAVRPGGQPSEGRGRDELPLRRPRIPHSRRGALPLPPLF